MRTREEQIKPWGYISPFATETLRDRAKCDLTITKKATHNITMPLYTEEHTLEAERRAEQRARAEIGRDSERLDWLLARSHYGIPGFDPVVSGRTPEKRRADLIRAIDAAREVG